MKETIFILITIFGLFSCEHQKTETKANKKVDDAVETTSPAKLNDDKDKNLLYNQEFIEGLSEYSEPIKLIENYMLVGHDTVYFPEELKLNQKTSFKGIKDNKNFVLKVTRNNMTTLTYDFKLLDQNAKVVNGKSGSATLGSLFFLGSETDIDDETGDGYLSVEYWDESDDCTFAIRIGEKNENGKLRAKIILTCPENQSKNIDLEGHPTLRAE